MRTKSNDDTQSEGKKKGLKTIQATGRSDAPRSGLKRKRNPTKPNDKKYECPEEGCDKSYSRAEHLYRHQLNHAPKQIYHCDFDGCDRHFVRQDLCTRHRERHTKENSHLYRRDTFKHNKRAKPSSDSVASSKALSPDRQTLSTIAPTEEPVLQTAKDLEASKSQDSILGYGHMALDPRLNLGSANIHGTLEAPSYQNAVDNGSYIQNVSMASIAAPLNVQLEALPSVAQTSANNVTNPSLIDSEGPTPNAGVHDAVFVRPPLPQTHSMDLYQLNSMQYPFTPLNTDPIPYLPQPYLSPTSMASLRSPPPLANVPGFSHYGLPYGIQPSPPQQQSDVRADSVTSHMSKGAQADLNGMNHGQHASYSNTGSDHLPASTTIPVFNEDYGPSPFEFPGVDFISWLFEGDQNIGFSPLPRMTPSQPEFRPQVFNDTSQLPRRNVTLESIASPDLLPGAKPASIRPEPIVSDLRRQRLLSLIISQYKDERHAQVTSQRERILTGDHDADAHILSLQKMQLFIVTFWTQVHPQLPILHKPTFSAETCPDLLLISIMTLGAASLGPSFSHELTQASTDFASFLAWHTRQMIFEDPDFLPPAKLWVFQALLLLEVFEKMFSTTVLHQRAHIHHATTLTLMRRGSSLIGRSAFDFPPYDKDPTRTPPGPGGSINLAGRNTKDEWWNNWISNEATRRTAFAAFIIDTTHATMFGHSAVMVAHEMRIPLPCDEVQWSAPSGAEVRKYEHDTSSNGLKTTGFLDALKNTLNNQAVRTNTFGRVVIMAGLLSVSWHMKMQDVRAKSTGVGKQGSWSDQLVSALNFWKRDFDASLAQSMNIRPRDHFLATVEDRDKVFESRTVLYHLARMAMHVDIIDCQILAGSKRSLGRVITATDRAAASRRMKENWAPSQGARDATFYALRFLSTVLLPESDGSSGLHASSHGLAYSARDDNLLNRPWVLYFAALVVWAYGFSLDGPIAPPTYTLRTPEIKFRDLRGFLRRVGGVKSADDLQHVKHRNGCLGLLMLLKEIFNQTQWELLHEASEMLGNCIELLMPGISNT